jgi:ABC-type amino acid transport substrate-binding protein
MLVMRHIILLGVLSVSAQLALADSLHVCVDKNPLPPFVYSEKINGAGQLRGYSLDLVKQLLTGVGSAFDIKSLSTADLEKKLQSPDPKSGCDIVLDVSKNPAKEAFLWLTSPVYQLNYDVMYSWERYMTGMGVKSLADLNKLKICGITGYDYGSLTKQLKIKLIPNVKDAIFELKDKSCDGFIAEGVVMRYGQRMNSYQVPPVGCIRLDGTAKTYHIGIAKHVVGANVLLSKIQQQLTTLSAKGGSLSKLAETYDVNAISCQERLNVSP